MRDKFCAGTKDRQVLRRAPGMDYVPLRVTSRTAQAEQHLTRKVSAFPPDRQTPLPSADRLL